MLQVHDAHDVGQRFVFLACVGGRFGVGKEFALLGDAQLGEQDPAHARQLFFAEAAARKFVREHGPQARLQGVRVHAFVHLVLANDQMAGDGGIQPGLLKLLARDAGEHHAMPPGDAQLALVRAVGLQQLRVALQRVDDLNGAVVCLRQWVYDGFDLVGVAVQNVKALACRTVDGVEVPVLGFQNQRTTARVEYDKVRTGLFGANGHVPPQQGVVIEFLLQPFGQFAFPVGHAGLAAAIRRYQCCHVSLSPAVADIRGRWFALMYLVVARL